MAGGAQYPCATINVDAERSLPWLERSTFLHTGEVACPATVRRARARQLPTPAATWCPRFVRPMAAVGHVAARSTMEDARCAVVQRLRGRRASARVPAAIQAASSFLAATLLVAAGSRCSLSGACAHGLGAPLHGPPSGCGAAEASSVAACGPPLPLPERVRAGRRVIDAGPTA